MRPSEPLPTMVDVRSMLAEHEIHHVGVTDADVLSRARRAILERKAAGLHDEMAFTFRNPERSTDPRRAVEGARSVIVAARAYLPLHELDPPADAVVPARVGRYAWIDHYATLRAALREVALRLRRAGHRAVAFADDNSLVDRAIAERAGLGWFGKNANILLPGAGSYFVLGSVVTTAWYEPNAAAVPDGCGTCSRCIDACPTGAIVEPGVIDASRCLSWVGQKPGTMQPSLRSAMHDRIYGCDDCQDACPVSVRLGRRNTIDIGPDAHAWVDAVELLEREDDWILDRYGRWYIAGRDVTWLRRNALVIVGNIGDPVDTRVAAVVERYRTGSDPILADHAAWARSRLDERLLEPAAP